MFQPIGRRRIAFAAGFAFVAIACGLKFIPVSQANSTPLLFLPLMTTTSLDTMFSRPMGLHDSKIAREVMTDTADGRSASVVILMVDQANVNAAFEMKDQDARGWYVYNTLTEHAERTQADLRSFLSARGIAYRSFWGANMIVTNIDRSIVEQIADRADVSRIDSNRPARWIEDPAIADKHETSARPDAVEWGVDNVNAPAVWAMGFTGQGIVIGDLDTGTRWSHVALKPKYRGWNGTSADHNYNWHDAVHSGGGVCGADTQAPCDDDGHGTHTAGSIVGDDGSGNQIGVAPGARWIGCRNMDQGNGTPAMYTECFQFTIAPTDLAGNNPDPTRRPHVLNNSWTCPFQEGCTTRAELETIVNNTQAAGIFVEASAGNSGPGCSTVEDAPAIYSSSFSTGAINISNDLVGFSSRGPSTFYSPSILKPNISAPGSNVRSSYGDTDSSYVNLSGTSMAGPHVVGVVALLWSARPELVRDIAATKALLQNTANPNVTVSGGTQTCGGTPSTQIPNNSFGYGRVDALAAVTAAGPTPSSTNTPNPTPSDDPTPTSTVTSTRTPTNTATGTPTPPTYEIFDIGIVLPTDTASQGTGVSTTSVALGRSFRAGNTGAQAFSYTQAGGLAGLPNLPGRAFCVSNAARDSALIVGTCSTTAFGSSRLPTLWNNGVVSQMNLPIGETLGDAFDINQAGTVVGSVNSGSLQRGAIYLGGVGTVISATTANGSFFTTAFGINNSGRVAGIGIDPGNAARNVPMIWDVGQPTAIDIGALPGFNGAIPFAISDGGHVVGSSMLNQGSGLPFIWTPSGGMVAIPLAAGTTQGSARAVNSSGWVVGQDSNAFSIPFLWDGTTTYRLQDIIPAGTGWDLSTNTSSSAMGISDDNVIVGTGVLNGAVHAFYMMPSRQNTPTSTPTQAPTSPTPTFTSTATSTPTNTPTVLPSPFPEYDLRISQSAPASTATFPVVYTLTVSNVPSVLGGGACPNVRFTYPAGVPFSFGGASGTNGYNPVADVNGITFTGGCVSSTGGNTGTATLTVSLFPQSGGVLTSLGSNVVVDPENNWNESDETNNTAETVQTIIGWEGTPTATATATSTGTPTNTPTTQPTSTATSTSTATPTATPSLRSRADFDGDNKTDISVFRPSEGNWYLNGSTQSFRGMNFGLSNDIPTPGDFDGDGITDIAVFRPSDRYWYRMNSGNGTFVAFNFGLSGDIPQAGDFDGDRKDDIAVFRPANGTWYWHRSSDDQYSGIQWGQNGDMPVAGDYDGDGKDDVAVFRPSTGYWYGLAESSSFSALFGSAADLPVPADYDGDNREDLAIFRPADGNWYRFNSSDHHFVVVHWGQNGDVPVPGDYDGDGKDDVGVFRSGIWYIDRSNAGFFAYQFGLGSDIPILKEYLP